MRTRRDWKSVSPDSASVPSTSAAAPTSPTVVPSREMSSISTIRKNWSLQQLCKYDDFWKMDKLITDKQMEPTRVVVDKCYSYFASANIIKVLAKHGAPMKPAHILHLEPLTHYVVSYVMMYKTLNYKDKKKYLEVIQYLKDEGYPLEPALDGLTTMGAPSDHEVYSVLTPPPSRDPSPSLSHSTTTSSVSSPLAAEDSAAGAAPAAEPREMLISLKRKPSRTSSGNGKRGRYSL